MYDYIIVGAGFYGSVFAREVKDAGKSVLVLEKRDHIGGNCFSYDYKNTHINIHKYGPHIFHTSNKDVWEYVNRFSPFIQYYHKVFSTFKGRVYSLPINLQTINYFYNVNLKPYEVPSFLKDKQSSISKPANLEEQAISIVGRDLYEAFFKGYTIKQWDVDPKDLPAKIITRLPVRFSYNDSYYNDIYQGLPVNGYTPLFEKLLQEIPVKLNTDYFTKRDYWRSNCKVLVYTGPLDRYFEYQFGRLSWRSIRFEMEDVGYDDYQGAATMNFADPEVPYTRIVEPKHFYKDRAYPAGKTVIIKEYSCVNDDEPYYPVRLRRDRDNLTKYKLLARKENNVIFGGRLGDYKYYDMHHVVRAALKKAQGSLGSI